MDKKSISLIIAAYNCAPYLETCLESVFCQTFSGKVEVIVCDDCSNDNSISVLQRYVDDGRIILIENKENLGAAKSRNLCLEKATGDYVALLDADDYITKDKLEVQVDVLEKHPEVAFVSSALCRFYPDGVKKTSRTAKPFPSKNDFLKGLPFNHATTMFRRKALESVGGYRVAWETRRDEDYDLFMRLYAVGFQGMNIPDVLYYYRCFVETSYKNKYKYRISEVVVRYKGFKALRLGIKAVPFVVKPLIVGLIPKKVLLRISGVK